MAQVAAYRSTEKGLSTDTKTAWIDLSKPGRTDKHGIMQEAKNMQNVQFLMNQQLSLSYDSI